jgi:hypothetical protein
MKVFQTARNKWNNGIKLSRAKVEKIFMNNPQNYREVGFEKCWHQDLKHDLKLRRGLILYGIFCKKR